MENVKTLVLEDDHRDANILDRHLSRSTRYDFNRYYASTIAEAIELIKTENFDVLFADLKVVNGSGLTLLTRLRAAKPNLGIIVVTGSMEADERDVVSQHCQSILLKDGLTLLQIETETKHILVSNEVARLRIKLSSRWKKFFKEWLPEILGKIVKIFLR